MKWGLAVLSSCCVLSVGASAQSNSATMWTWGPLERKVQGYWVNTNVPSGCRWGITDQAKQWTNAALNFTYTYKGLTSYAAWYWDPNRWNSYRNAYGDNVSTVNNNIDTQVEGGTVDSGNDVAQTEYTTRSYTGGRYVFADADIVVNSGIWSTTAWCSPSLPVPTNMNDFASIGLHELGHVMGLDHDGDDINRVTVVVNPYVRGENKRTLKQRDIDRAVYLYGL